MITKVLLTQIDGTLTYKIIQRDEEKYHHELTHKDKLFLMELFNQAYLDLRESLSDNKGEL